MGEVGRGQLAPLGPLPPLIEFLVELLAEFLVGLLVELLVRLLAGLLAELLVKLLLLAADLRLPVLVDDLPGLALFAAAFILCDGLPGGLFRALGFLFFVRHPSVSFRDRATACQAIFPSAATRRRNSS